MHDGFHAMGCNCAYGRKELMLLHFQSYYPEAKFLFDSIIASLLYHVEIPACLGT